MSWNHDFLKIIVFCGETAGKQGERFKWAAANISLQSNSCIQASADELNFYR